MKNESKIKGLSKAISIIACIIKICVRVALVCLVLAMLVIPYALSNVKVSENSIEIHEKRIDYEENIEGITITINNNQEKITSPQDIAALKTFLNYFKENKSQLLTIYIELTFVFIAAIIVCIDFALQHLQKLFKNIHDNDNPFLIENATHLRKMGYFLIATLVISIVSSIWADVAFQGRFTLNFSMVNILEILFVLCLSYIFEYGASLTEKKTRKESKNE